VRPMQIGPQMKNHVKTYVLTLVVALAGLGLGAAAGASPGHGCAQDETRACGNRTPGSLPAATTATTATTTTSAPATAPVETAIATTTSTTTATTPTTTTTTTTTSTTPTTTTAATTTGTTTSSPVWGMAGGYTSSQLSTLSGRGIRLGLVEMSWARAEPQEGVWDETYFQSVRNQISAMKVLGFRIVLNYGMHHAPSWLLSMPNARFVNQYGDIYTGSDEANLVFAKALRSYAEVYTSKVFAELGTDFFAVRVGGGHWGELQYPGQKDAAGKWEWWAFDGAATAQTPAPGYVPCSGDPTKAGTFLNWYLDALTNFQNWQIATVRKSYSGAIAVLYASWGMRSGDFEKATGGNLCGTSSAEINGEVQRGYDHARQISAVTDPGAVVWGTWGDNAGTISYLAGLAAAKGLQVMAENSGQDTRTQMQTAVSAARQYGLAAFMWIRASDAFCFCSGYATIDDYDQLTAG
jgi:glycosyl hydrolase family 42 (putative beta-galactosidase)